MIDVSCGAARRAGFVLLLAMVSAVGCNRDGPDTGASDSGEGESTTRVDPMFASIASSSGMRVRHFPGESQDYFFPEIMGGGAALLDFDRDGRLDVYLVNGRSWRTGADDGADDPRAANQLFRQGEDGKFVDVTAASGVGDTGYGMGVAVGDVNNDGWPDLYVSNFGPDRLYLNSGDGTFRDITDAAGIDNLRWGASVTFLDFDRDGWLDIFVTNYVDYFPSRKCGSREGRPDYCSPSNFAGTADKLFRNRGRPGDPQFEDVSAIAGIASQRGPGLGVLAADFNGDHWPDLYVANDGTANFLWINGQDGTFREEAILSGCAYDAHGRPQAGMGIAVGMLNDDGLPDLIVTHLAGETTALYASDGAGAYLESAMERGVARAGYERTGFGVALFDVELDGDLDLAVVNGRVARPKLEHERQDAPLLPTDRDEHWDPYAERNQLFVNDGDDRWHEVSADEDPFWNGRGVSRALCCGDIDNDGDVDLLLTNLGADAQLLRNDATRVGHWLILEARLPDRGDRYAVGAVITVQAGGRRIDRFLSPQSSYLSSHDPRLHFGLGDATSVEFIEVRWPDGSVERFSGGEVDVIRVLRRGEGETDA